MGSLESPGRKKVKKKKKKRANQNNFIDDGSGGIALNNIQPQQLFAGMGLDPSDDDDNYDFQGVEIKDKQFL